MEPITGTGIWAASLRYGDPGVAAEGIAELESLGYSAAWIPDIGGDVFTPLAHLLASTSTMTIATGILNVWMHTAAETGEWRAGLPADQRDRFLLGIGISHAPLIDPQPGMSWDKPLATTRAYLDALDEAGVPADARCVAALGPKMLELARERSAGAHPYLVTPEHTAIARGVLGDAGLYVEQGVVFETDPDVAREIARKALDGYCGLPNYVNNWKRLGFTQDDVDAKTDRLVDALVVHGDVEAIAARVQQHRDAGADHVCIQVLNAPGAPMNRTAWRELAPALT
jgi:probable F420-dependent oxidoreductase